MKIDQREKRQAPPSLILRLAVDDAGGSFFYTESWQKLQRVILACLFTLSLLPLWMTCLSLELNVLSQSLFILISFALIYLLIQFPKILLIFLALFLSLTMIGSLLPTLPIIGKVAGIVRTVFTLFYNRVSFGFGLEENLIEASFAASSGLVVFLSLLVSLMLLWRPLPFLAFIFSSVLFAFSEEIIDSELPIVLRLAYIASILIILLIWMSGLSRERYRSGDRATNINDISRVKRTIPISAVLLSLVILLDLLIPSSFFYVKSLDDYMSKLFGQRHQEASSIPYLQFSLRDLGYYPLENRLGGKPDLSEEPYMYVDTDPASIYLRGTAYLDFTGLAWTQDGMNPNWLIDHPRNQDAQKELLGQLYAGTDSSVQELMPNRSFELRPIKEQQVIFNGGRPEEFLSLNRSSFNVYFNRSANLYLDKIVGLDGYRGNGQWFSVRDLREKDNLEKLIGLFPDSIMSAEEKDRWLKLPQLTSLSEVLQNYHPELYELVYAEDYKDLDRVLAIRSYLADNLDYNLEVGVPPDTQDFVSYFLESGEGYCTYFATAFTVLLRSAGIPARYVEGFLLPQSETGATRELTGANGHAWTEVWFDGLGWVPLDATPAEALDQLENTNAGSMNEQTETTPTSPATDKPIVETEAPLTEDQEGADDSEKEESPGLNILSIIGFILRVLLGIILFSSPLWLYLLWRYIVYKRRHDPDYLNHRLNSSSVGDLITVIDLDLQSIWRLSGQQRHSGETIRDFVIRSEAERKADIDDIYVDLTERIYYDDIESIDISEEELDAFLNFYKREEERLKEILPRKIWLLKRFVWSDYHPLPQ